MIAIFVACLAAVEAVARAQSPADRVSYDEVDLGQPSGDALKDNKDNDVVVSPDSAHVAYWRGGRGETIRTPDFVFGDGIRLMLDGRPGPEFGNGATPVFSPDSQHVCYIAGHKEGRGFVLVVDGKEEDHGVTAVHGSPMFSPDATRVVYASMPDDKHYALVVDGKKQATYDGIGAVVFSDDGKRIAYSAQRGDTWLVVTDGVEGKPYPALMKDSIVFSPDGRHLAYIAKVADEQWALVMDGRGTKPVPGFNRGSPRLSPDGKRMGVIVRFAEDKKRVVINGKPMGDEFESIDPFVFSADGQHVAFAASRGGQWMIVRDGVAGKAYDDVQQPPIFSKDGTALVYAAKKGGKWMVVASDVEQQPVDAIDDICVSADGQHVAYRAAIGAEHVVVRDNQILHRSEKEIGPIALSPDGRNVVYWLVQPKGNSVLMIGDRPGPSYDGTVKESRVVFDSSRQCHALAHRDGHIYRVELRFDPPYRM